MHKGQGKVPVTLVQQSADPVVAELFGRLAKGSVGVVNLHRTLAQSPEVFSAFIGLAHALRFKTTVAPLERELAILRVLERHHGHYEVAHHRKMAKAAGATDAQLEGTAAAALDAALYDARQLAVLRYADAFAVGAGVDGPVSEALQQVLDARQVVELSLTLALYCGLAHFTSSLDIPAD